MPIRPAELITPFDVRLSPSPAPSAGIFDEPTVPLCINREWAAHVQGVIGRLTRYDAWTGDFDEQYRATQEILKLIVTFGAGMFCMTDFCCDETNEKLQTMIDQQITIINHIVTTINNQNTQITMSDLEIFQTVVNNYNQTIANNYNTSIINQMLYDGTPQSIAPELGSDFSDGTDATENALCQALKRYLEWQCYTAAAQGGMAAGIAGGALAALIALAPLTLGLSVVAGLAAAAIGVGFLALQEAMSDPVAMRKVLCCMFDYMKDTAITEENFQSMGTCFEEWEFYSHEYVIAQQIGNSAAYYPDNYLGFLRMLGESQQQGNRADCDCCEAVEDYNIIALNDCVITKLNDYQYRIVQTNGISGGGDPFCAAYDYFTAEFQETEGRCIDIISGSGTAMSSWEQVDCAGEVHSGVGGGGGVGKRFKWQSKACPPDPTTMDITITIACPENLEIVP